MVKEPGMNHEPEGNVYTVSHTLSGLDPGDYEVILISRNSYGWSRNSQASQVSLAGIKL